MLNNLSDLKNAFLVRNQASTTIAFYTDTILNTWASEAHQWAASYSKWPFTEGRISTTYTTSTEEWSFEGIKPDSIRFIQIGGKRFQKINFEDYQIYRENNTSTAETGTRTRIYSDFGRIVYINPNTDASGTLTVYSQYQPGDFTGTDTDEETVFSNIAEEGNTAIVEEMLSYAKLREKKLQEGKFHHERAEAILKALWDNIASEQFAYQSKDRGIFERFDVLEGAVDDELLKRHQWF